MATYDEDSDRPQGEIDVMPLATAGPMRPLLPAGYRWMLIHWPGRWIVDPATGDVLPALTRASLEDGANHVPEGGDPTAAIVHYQRRGATVLADGCGEGVGMGASYRRKVAVRGGHAYIGAWETATPGVDGTQVDELAYRRLLLHLVTSGQIRPPTSYHLARLEDQARRRLDQAERAGVTDPVAARLVPVYRREIEIWQAVQRDGLPYLTAPADDVESEIDPTPIPKRPRAARQPVAQE